MKKNIYLFILLLVFVAAACKTLTCPDGFDGADDKCVCSSPKLQGNGLCRTLKPNEYYGITENCPCRDTVFFNIKERTNSQLLFSIDGQYSYKEGGSLLIQDVEGDSIYTSSSSPYWRDLGCATKGKSCTMAIFGRFIENDKKIRLTIKYIDDSTISSPTFGKAIDSCYFVLHK